MTGSRRAIVIMAVVTMCAVAVAALAVGYALGRSGTDSSAAQPSRSAVAPSSTPVESPSDLSPMPTEGLATCVAGLDKSPEGRLLLAKRDPMVVPTTEQDCITTDAAIVDLKAIADLSRSRRVYWATPEGVADVWNGLTSTCRQWKGRGIPVQQDLDELAMGYKTAPVLPGRPPLDEDLRVIAIHADHASESVCPEFRSQFLQWFQRHPNLTTLTVKGYRP